jgi:hypothetical protein
VKILQKQHSSEEVFRWQWLPINVKKQGLGRAKEKYTV